MQSKLIRIMCPNLMCRKVLSVPVEARGKTVRCRGCSSVIRIPAERPVAPPPPPPTQAQDQATD